jgi:tetratricopeptide (TPR) repeat protein
MRTRPTPTLLVVALAVVAAPAARAEDALQAMFERREAERERARCEALVRTSDVDRQVEGHTCLARRILDDDTPIATPVMNRHGKTSTRRVPSDAAATAALGHLRAARRLRPGKIELHRDVLALTTRSLRLLELPGEVKESLALAPRSRRDALLEKALLPTMNDLAEDARYEVALAVGKVVEREYPRSNQVASNVGGALLSLGRDAEALPYLERAVALAPGDPVDRWNLGQYRGRHGQLREADRDFAKAVSLAKKPEERDALGCRHASFVLLELKDRARACSLQEKHCPQGVRSACGAR